MHFFFFFYNCVVQFLRILRRKQLELVQQAQNDMISVTTKQSFSCATACFIVCSTLNDAFEIFYL